jgi:hypothetical protein
MKDKRDRDTRDWVDEDEERRFKEQRAMIRRKLRKDKFHERQDSTAPAPNRRKP